MNIFDILGPVMVGPSSSHTAGAVCIGYLTRKLLGGGADGYCHVFARFFCGDRAGARDRSPCE